MISEYWSVTLPTTTRHDAGSLHDQAHGELAELRSGGWEPIQQSRVTENGELRYVLRRVLAA
jgi:hypothetical protein